MPQFKNKHVVYVKFEENYGRPSRQTVFFISRITILNILAAKGPRRSTVDSLLSYHNPSAFCEDCHSLFLQSVMCWHLHSCNFGINKK